MNFILPESYNEILDTVRDKIKNAYKITDVQYQGSNVSILTNIFAYLNHMINTNMNFGINETIISKAQNKKNILLLAKELGYEPRRKRSYKYRIKLKSKTTGIVSIPKFTKFKNGDKDFVYIDETSEQKFGSNCGITIINRDEFNDLVVRKGDTPGTFMVTDDEEVLEVIEKVTIREGEKLMFNNISGNGEKISLYSKNPTSLYKRNPDTGEMIRLADIETFVVNDTDPNNKEFIIQLKNLEPSEIPTEREEVLKLAFFTDDCEYHKLAPDFEGFIASDYNYDSEIIKFNVNSNYVLIDGLKKYIDELITVYKLKRVSLAPADYSDNMYDPTKLVCILKNVEQVDTCTIEVTEGKLITYEDDPALAVNVDIEMQRQGYIPLDYQNIEQNGIFLEISRVNYKGELVLKEVWTQRDYYIAEKPFKGEDTTFVVLNDYYYDREYLNIYTQYANTGTPFYSGNIFYFKLLQSTGINGSVTELFTVNDDKLSEIFEVIPYFESKDNINDTINNVLVQSGADEEDIESIRKNAPLYNNLAQRLVTKHDYQTYCNLFQFVEQTEVWGGEELEEAPKLGNVFFSFIPKSRPVEYHSDDNKEMFTLKNHDNRELFFLPEQQILMEEDGGNPNSIFEELSKRKIITLQYQYVPPKYLDFIVEIKIIKYLIGKSNIELRQQLFDALRGYFDQIETFNAEIFESNMIKYVDRQLNDDSGIELKTYLEFSVIRDDFVETGFAEVETSSKVYTCQVLFQYPINGVFDDNVYSHTGAILEYGKLIKSRLPGIYNNGSFGKGVKITFDYEHIKYFKIVSGIVEEFQGTEVDIDSSVISFHVPMILDTTETDPLSPFPREIKQIGWLQVYNRNKVIYIQIDATDSNSPEDLAQRAHISYFEEKRDIGVENSANMVLKRNTFPRLKRVEIVEDIK